VRDTTSPTALLEVAKSSRAKIHLVKIVAGDEEGNKAAAKEVEGLVGRVDVLWANAGEFYFPLEGEVSGSDVSFSGCPGIPVC
jgi:NAD(P)-dependent dehydrogenase (short-subunit alcohol dehydrogenase family)